MAYLTATPCADENWKLESSTLFAKCTGIHSTQLYFKFDKFPGVIPRLPSNRDSIPRPWGRKRGE